MNEDEENGRGAKALRSIEFNGAENLLGPSNMRNSNRSRRYASVLEELQPSSSIFCGIWPESLAVALHTAAFATLMLVVGWLERVSKEDTSIALDTPPSYKYSITATAVALARLVCRFLPQPLRTLRYPGFFVSQAALLLPLYSRMGCIPHLPCRVCEFVMGRINRTDLLKIISVHLFVGTVVLDLFTISNADKQNMNPIVYEKNLDAVNAVFFFVKEIVTVVVFVVGLLVLPVVLSINHLSGWWTPILLYPVYITAVDPTGMGSTLNPTYLYAQSRLLDAVPSFFWQHLVPQVLGGVYAGRVMNRYFPDDR